MDFLNFILSLPCGKFHNKILYDNNILSKYTNAIFPHQNYTALRNTKFNTWEKGSWRGVIHFDKVIKNIIEDLKANPDKDFEVDYSTLIFLYQSMMEPKGIGLETARAMAKFENYNEETGKPYEENIPVTYSGILEKVMIEVQQLSNVDKKLTILKERVNLAYAGLKMNLKIQRMEEFLEFHDAITAENVDQDPDVKAAMKS